MKSGRRNSVITVVQLVLTSFVLFACLALVGERALAQGGRPTTTPDNKYGEGGTKTTTRDALNRIIKEEWADKSGKVIERTETTYHKDKKEKQDSDVVKTVKTWFYRVTSIGRVLRTQTTKEIDRADRESVETLDYDETGSKVIVKTVTTPKGVTRFRRNPATGEFEKDVSSASPPSVPASPPTTTPAPSTDPAPAQPPSSDERTAEVMLVNYTPVEFYFGFSHNRVDGGDEREGFNGFATSLTSNFNRHAGPKVYYSFHTRSFEENGFGFSSRASIHQFLGGVQFQDNALENGPVRPFAHLMAGIAHHKFTFDDGTNGFSDNATGFAGVIGGGLDIRINDHVDFRVQVDYNPNRINDEWQQNVRAGFGLVFNFGRKSNDDVDDDADSRDPSISLVPQKEAEKCVWVRENLGKDTNVTEVKSNKPKEVEVRIANFAASGGFEYHCLDSRGTALITYKYTDVNGANQEGKLRVICK